MNKRDDFSQKTIDRLCERVGGKCSNPNCRRETKGHHSNPQKRVSIGEAAHITAAAEGGPRYNPDLTPEERSSIENGIWLCKSCARMIDIVSTSTSNAGRTKAALISLTGCRRNSTERFCVTRSWNGWEDSLYHRQDRGWRGVILWFFIGYPCHADTFLHLFARKPAKNTTFAFTLQIHIWL